MKWRRVETCVQLESRRVEEYKLLELDTGGLENGNDSDEYVSAVGERERGKMKEKEKKDINL